MDPITFGITLGAAGAAGGEGLYVDDVFSTYLYEGNGSTQTITNGIDLSGEGGMVWVKNRGSADYDHQIADTERGNTYYLRPDSTLSENSGSGALTSFNNNGFSLGNAGNFNLNGADQVSWTFRKAPGFFDVVTWSGNSTVGRVIPHSLGSAPGMILIKSTSSTYDWVVWHRDLANNEYLYLNTTAAKASSDNYFNNTTPDASGITLSSSGFVNGTGETYVAYIFAHDDQSFGTNGDESIIKCGSYTGNGSSTGPVIDLGWEPQWLLVKQSSISGANWVLIDNMRGFTADGVISNLYVNSSSAETQNVTRISPFSNGFQPRFSGYEVNQSGETYIYIAIRRPHKPPEAATEVFSVNTTTNDNNFNTTGFPVDAAIAANTNHTYGNMTSARFLGQKALFTNSTAAESSLLTADTWTSNTSFRFAYAGGGYNWANYAFKRAPSFFDVVAYTGDGTYDGSYSVNHNLEVVPEMIIAKNRGSVNFWNTYHSGLTSDTYQLNLNRNSAQLNTGQSWGPSAASFKPQYAGNSDYSSNHSGQNYIAYLFATLPGISKVGSYSGTGSDINVDCGFTAGARFVMIKRTDTQIDGQTYDTDWYVWDTARGIVSGNDPYLVLNETAAEVTSTDFIDPLNAGFTVTSSAPAALNASGGTYIFLAIA